MKRELVLPNSFEELENEEMMYLEGGYRTHRTTYIPSQTLRISKAAYAANIHLGNFIIGAGLSFVTGGSSILIATANGIGNVFFGASGTNALANQADAEDGKSDGWVTRKISAYYVTELNPYPPNSFQGATF